MNSFNSSKMTRILLLFFLLGSVTSFNILNVGGRIGSRIAPSKTFANKCCGCIIDNKDTCALRIKSSEKCSDLCPTIFGNDKKRGKWDGKKRDMSSIMAVPCGDIGRDFCNDTLIRKYEEKLDCMQLKPAIELQKFIGKKMEILVQSHIDRKIFHRYECKGTPLITVAFEIELKKLQNTLQHIDKLQKTAINGKFSLALLTDRQSIFINRGVPIQNRIETIANWICDTSNTLNPYIVGVAKFKDNTPSLSHYKKQVSIILQNNQNLFDRDITMDNIRKIHKEFTTLNSIDINLYRAITGGLENKYGTAEAGSFAQEYALNKIEPHWNIQDKAMFLLSSHIRAHGFVDGNGRTIRAVYGLILLNQDIIFRLPSYSLVTKLAGFA